MDAKSRNLRVEEGHEMPLWTAMLFYRFCGRYKIQDIEGRKAVLRELVRRKKAKYVRDVQERIVGKKILKIRGKNA